MNRYNTKSRYATVDIHDAYKQLATDIIMMAIKDYQKYWMNKCEVCNVQNVNCCVEFFKGEWFEELCFYTDTDPELIRDSLWKR